MSVPVWCADRAAEFWAAAGDPPPFPRDLRPSIAGAVPLSVIDLRGLRVAAVAGWFAARGVAVPLDEPDRPLRACLVAWLGQGFAFIEEADDAAERRFSLAHELAHFLHDYWHPRETAVTRLGPGVREALDGRRPATADERLHGLLRNAPVGPFAHLLRRDESGRPRSFAEREAETAADRLAFELLAPAAAVLATQPNPPAPFPGKEGGASGGALPPVTEASSRLLPSPLRGGAGGEVTARLVTEFGLPPGPAARYADLLAPDRAPRDRLVSRLFRS